MARLAPLVAVVLPERGIGPARRVSRTAALAALVRHSPWVALRDEHAVAHLEALSTIARRVATFALPHGERDLQTLAARFIGLA